MAEFIFVRPKDGLNGVVDPERRDRLPEGKYRRVESAVYWQRLAAMGDVTLTRVEPPAAEIEGYEATPAGEPVTDMPKVSAAEAALYAGNPGKK